MNTRIAEPPAGYTPDLSQLPAVDCAPWCAEGNGHVDAIHPDDQACHDERTRLPLRRERMLIDDVDLEDRSMSFLDVEIWREWNAAEAHISVSKDEVLGFAMTLDEADRLAHALLERVALARKASR